MIIRTALVAAAILWAFSSSVSAEVGARKPNKPGYITLEVQGLRDPYWIVLTSRSEGGRQTRERFKFGEDVRTVFIHGGQLRNLANRGERKDTFESACVFIAKQAQRPYGWGGNPYYCISAKDPTLSRSIEDALAGRSGSPVIFPAPHDRPPMMGPGPYGSPRPPYGAPPRDPSAPPLSNN